MAGLLLLDTTVLSNFGHVRRSDLVYVFALANAATTTSVLREYGVAVAAGLLPGDLWKDLPVITLSSEEERLASSLPAVLGAGERTCIAVAIERRGVLATDDSDARKVARRFGISITGTLGLLIQAVRIGRASLPEANELLLRMIQSGYHSPVTDLAPYVS